MTIDGRTHVVTGGTGEAGVGRVRLWDLTTGRVIGPELLFPAPVRSLAVAPGDRLVVAFGHEIAVLSRTGAGG